MSAATRLAMVTDGFRGGAGVLVPSTVVIYEQIEVELMGDIEVEIDDAEIVAELEGDLTVELESELNIEV